MSVVQVDTFWSRLRYKKVPTAHAQYAPPILVDSPCQIVDRDFRTGVIYLPGMIPHGGQKSMLGKVVTAFRKFRDWAPFRPPGTAADGKGQNKGGTGAYAGQPGESEKEIAGHGFHHIGLWVPIGVSHTVRTQKLRYADLSQCRRFAGGRRQPRSLGSLRRLHSRHG